MHVPHARLGGCYARPVARRLLSAVILCCACPSASSGDGAATSSPVPSADPATVTARASASVETPPEAPLLQDLPASRAPTLDEWKSAKKLQVRDASLLGCVAESVREWVRVSCRKPSIGGGRPANVTVLSPANGVLTFANGGVTSVQFRYGRGFELDALFTFGGQQSIMPLEIRWPVASPEQPSRIGKFVGVPRVTQAEHDKACACLDDIMRSACTVGYFAPECLRQVEDTLTCTTLIQCQNAEPSGVAKCAEGETHDGPCPTCRCARICKADRDCPQGFVCGPTLAGTETVCGPS